MVKDGEDWHVQTDWHVQNETEKFRLNVSNRLTVTAGSLTSYYLRLTSFDEEMNSSGILRLLTGTVSTILISLSFGCQRVPDDT